MLIANFVKKKKKSTVKIAKNSFARNIIEKFSLFLSMQVFENDVKLFRGGMLRVDKVLTL